MSQRWCCALVLWQCSREVWRKMQHVSAGCCIDMQALCKKLLSPTRPPEQRGRPDRETGERGEEGRRVKAEPTRGRILFRHVEFSGPCDEEATEADAEAEARPPAQEHHPQEQVERECALLVACLSVPCTPCMHAVLCCCAVVSS